MEPIKGYTILTNTISGYELIWRVIDENGDYPEIYETELEAQKAIVQEQMDICQEFLSGDRKFDEMVWVNEEYIVAHISIQPSGEMLVWLGEEGATDVIIETSLSDWRNNL